MDVQPLLLRLFTVPIEASVKINGKLLGLTKSSGLKLLCKQGDSVTIEKAGFETVTLVFFSAPQQPPLTRPGIGRNTGQAERIARTNPGARVNRKNRLR